MNSPGAPEQRLYCPKQDLVFHDAPPRPDLISGAHGPARSVSADAVTCAAPATTFPRPSVWTMREPPFASARERDVDRMVIAAVCHNPPNPLPLNMEPSTCRTHLPALARAVSGAAPPEPGSRPAAETFRQTISSNLCYSRAGIEKHFLFSYSSLCSCASFRAGNPPNTT